MKNIVKEFLSESINLRGHTFDMIKIGNTKIKVGKDGIRR